MRLRQIYDLYRLDPARITFAAEKALVVVKETLEKFDQLSKKDAALIENMVARYVLERAQVLLERAMAEARETRELQVAWEHQEDDGYPPEMRVVDAKMDRLVYALEDALEGQIRVMEPNEADLAPAQALLKKWFPTGAVNVAQGAYVREADEVKRIARVAEEQAELVARLGLMVLIHRINALIPEYERLLKAPRQAPALKHDDVQAALDRANDTLLEFVSAIVGHYSAAEQEATRDQYLAPVWEQNEATAAELKRPRKKK